VANVVVFRVGWPGLSIKAAKSVMKAWQSGAPQAPRTIDSNLVVSKNPNGTLDLHAKGQSVGTLPELRRELQELPRAQSVLIRPMTFSDAVAFFSGKPGYPTRFMKGKSDYAAAPISDQGLDVLPGWRRVSRSMSYAMLTAGRWRRLRRTRRLLPTGAGRCSACNTAANGMVPLIRKSASAI
jgi:hypothetical protein